jgi:general stress protein YciG
MAQEMGRGSISVQEAGHRGGSTVARKYGRGHFQEIGRKGGQRVRQLIQEAKEMEGGTTRGSRSSR